MRSVDWNPQYHYDPKFAWKGVKTNRKLTVQPGPNNPVGVGAAVTLLGPGPAVVAADTSTNQFELFRLS